MKLSPLLLASLCLLGMLSAPLALAQATFEIVASFPQTPSLPAYGLAQTAGGTKYALVRFGGTGDAGALAKVDESTNAVVAVANFATIGGELGDDQLALAVDGETVFGVTSYGGANGDGTLWSYNATDGLVKLANFSGTTNGEKPHHNVVWDSSTDTLYGVCEAGGAYNGGTLWKWTQAGGLVRLYSFQNFGDPLSLGGRPQSIALNAGKLYGIALEPDNGTGPDIPVLWSRSATGTMKQETVFDSDTQGYPIGPMLPCDAGVVGISYTSATTLSGTPRLWRFDPTAKLSIAKTFASTDADITIGTPDNFGICGTTRAGQVWSWAPDDSFTKIGTLSVTTTGEPAGQIVVTSGGEIFGTGLLSTDGSGTAWQWAADSTDVLASFEGLTIGGDPNGLWIDGNGSVFGVETIKQLLWRYSPATGPTPTQIGDVENPLIGFVTFGGVVGDGDGNLYGFTRLGAAGNAGVLWRWNAQTGLAKVGIFGTTSVPGNATGAIAAGNDGTIYGTTEQVISSVKRTHLWCYKMSGGLKKLATLDLSDGGAPTQTLVVSPDGGAVYGTCTTGGTNNKGTLWAWNQADGVQKLADFGSTAVPSPGNGLAISPLGVVFGVTSSGGATGDGRIWKWLPLSGLSAVKDFARDTTGTMIDTTHTGLLLADDGMLYGTTENGGTGGVGTLWRCNVGSASATLTTLKNFSPLEIAHPSTQRMMIGPDGRIYGLGLHGIWRYGVAPATPPPPAAITLAASYTSATHVIMEGSVNALGDDATITFEYGTSPDALDETGTPSPDAATGSDATPTSLDLTGLTPKTTYYYRVVITNANGTTKGDIASVKTTDIINPIVVTKPASNPSATGLTLNAVITPKSDATTSVSFDIGTASNNLATNVPATTVTGAGAAEVNVDATGLLPHTRYYFRARAINDNGGGTGSVLSAYTLNSAPTATDDDATVLPSASVLIPVLDNDSDPDSDTLSVLSFTQPASSAGKVTKATGGLRFTATAAFVSATFTYTVSDGFGGTATATVNLTRATASIDPTSRTIGSAGLSYPVHIVTDSAWAAVSGVSWVTVSPKEGIGESDVALTVAPNTGVSARIGTIVIGGIAHTVTQTGVVKPTLTVPSTIPVGSLCAAYRLAIPTTGQPVTYTASNLPSGLRLSTSGIIEGTPLTPGFFTVSIKASNAAGNVTISFPIQVNPLPVTNLGSFTALVARHDMNKNLGGLLTFSSTSAGNLTGKLSSGADAFNFTGRIAAVADNSAPNTATISIARRGLPPLVLAITFDAGSTANAIAVSISDGTNTVSARGGRHTFSGTSASGYAFTYNALLDLGAVAPDEAVPQGNGYLITKVLGNGNASWSGKLSDGTAISGATALWSDARLPLWQLLYSNTGSLSGSEGITLPAATIVGSIDWLRKPQGITERKYQAGFGPINLAISGGKYVSPATTSVIAGLSLVDQPDNARLRFAEGGLAVAEQAALVNQVLRITTQNKAELASSGSTANLTGVKLNLTAASGMFSGSFTLRDSNLIDPAKPYLRPVSFEGLIVPNLSKGAGFFLLNQLPSGTKTLTTSKILSGQVVLDANPPPSP